ncbi:MAG TPA: DNA-formamidopyrimidine glycosylase family protein [Baekduia sp.]|uniref:Fpg/Nei family DNA glycosylase n=1 Tax=Baekduia sp. TaxID=2600305 RepID=UPI002D06DE83|nr:DNA-formamidopyrimidine glycosylase family protein [Baekduia sp.]HMJ32691.1 DNA-formamidopyrimidine glycosylase family protein [Baekduia sp.]
MPEGDTIHYAANRIRPVLLDRVPDELRTPHPRFGRDRWPERLQGRPVEAVEAHGKHLFLRFAGDLTIHSHLRMTGAWGVYPEGRRWGRSPRGAWLVLRARDTDVVQFHGPVLELLTETRRRFDLRLAALGPDIIKEDFDVDAVLRRLREDDPTRGIGDALLDQRTIAGIGNVWKVEGCWRAQVDPWRPSATVSDDEVRRILAETRPAMRESALDGNQTRHRRVYGKAGRPCPRCGERILARGQGDDNRTTYWCPGCQT